MEVLEEAPFVIVGPVAAAVLSACALRRFAERDVSWLAFFTSVAGFTLGFSIIAVVPYDVWAAVAVRENSKGNAFEHDSHPRPLAELTRSSWKAIYWATVCICYVLCPVLIEFEASADFTGQARLRTSLRRNVYYYLITSVLGLVLLVWLVLHGKVHGSLESWCIAVSNAWSMIMLTVLMGFGLVAVPRHLRRLANPGEELKRLYACAVALDEARLSGQFELQDAIAQVRASLMIHGAQETRTTVRGSVGTVQDKAFATLRNSLAKSETLIRELTRRGCDENSGSCSSSPGGRQRGDEGTFGGESGSYGDTQPTAAATHRRPAVSSPPVRRLSLPASEEIDARHAGVDLVHLGKLHLELKRAALEARRSACCWESHVQRCILYEDLEDQQFHSAADLVGGRSGRMSGGRGGGGPIQTWFVARAVCLRRQHASGCWRFLLRLWFRSVRARALMALSLVCSVLSAVIVLGQFTLLTESWSLSLLSLFFVSDHGPLLTQALCIVPLSYMTYTAYFSMFRLKISGWYGLYGNHSTDSGSLLWCASVLSRLAAPLCYHFLKLIRVRGTSFQAFMGRMNVVPVLGEEFNEAFPCLVAVLCVLNIFNVYSRILQCFSFGLMEFEGSPHGGLNDPATEGAQLIARERRRLAEEASCDSHDAYELPRCQRSGDGCLMPLGGHRGGRGDEQLSEPLSGRGGSGNRVQLDPVACSR